MTIEEMVKIYDNQFEEWNKEFPIEKQSADEVQWDIAMNRVDDEFNIPFDRKHEVSIWIDKFVKIWNIIVETDWSVGETNSDIIYYKKGFRRYNRTSRTDGYWD
jgi:hypothetical protein